MRDIKGIVPPMVTPLAGRDRLDLPGLERLIEHILAGGVHGLFILGSTGEAPSLSYNLRRELIERTCRQVDGRVPVFVGITDTAFIESVSLAEYAASHGATAAVIAPPYYFPAGQAELIEYFQAIADALPLPVVLYNMPACTKTPIEIETLRPLLSHPNVAAYKDSSGDMTYFHKVIRLLKDHPGKTVLIGPEEQLSEATLLGGNGGVSGGANLFPQLYVDLYEAAARQDIQAVQHFHQRVMDISTSLYGIGKHRSSTIKGIKCALSCLGICNDDMAEPFHKFRDYERAIVLERVEALNGLAVGEHY